MKKRLISILLFLLFICSLVTGCNMNSLEDHLDSYFETSTEEKASVFDMELVGESHEGRFHYYRDTVTDMIFIYCRSSSANTHGGGLTVMMDPETGLPLTYTRYMELANAVIQEN